MQKNPKLIGYQEKYNDAVGNKTNVVYAVSPALVFGYDALNRVTNMVDAVGTTLYSYYVGGEMKSEDGPWASDTVGYTYQDSLRSTLALQQPNASDWAQSYGYDYARRLASLTSPAGTFAYTYAGAGNLLTNLALPSGAAITNAFDAVGRMLSTRLRTSGGSILNEHVYTYNAANERTRHTRKDGSYVDYSYDALGQLRAALGKESGGVTNRLHEQLGYLYDAAGNLSTRTNNALLQSFGVNNLNQFTNSSRSGTLTVAGTSSSAATSVTVKDNANAAVAAILYGDTTFARTNVTVLNGTNTFTAVATSATRGDTNVMTVNLPAAVTYLHDGNGNLTNDVARSFVYDDENQLTSVSAAAAWKVDFVYDGRMRRRVRKDYLWSGSSFVQTNEVRYVYDGLVVLQERNANNLPQVSYTRGRDLGGGLQRAGGIGGLLARTDNTMLYTQPTAATAYYHADAGGNITALMSQQQVLVAKYLYDSFGNPLSKTGPLADANTQRFSSMETHPNSGITLYLYRPYDPNLQRWIGRDPIGEEGGINLYRFGWNDPPNGFDTDGRFWREILIQVGGVAGGAIGGGFSIILDGVTAGINLPGTPAEIAAGAALGAAIGGGFGALLDELGKHSPLGYPNIPTSPSMPLRCESRMSPDQEAVKDLADEATNGGRKPLSVSDTEALLDWLVETGYPGWRAGPNDVTGKHWIGPHINIPGAGRPGGHIPVEPGVPPR